MSASDEALTHFLGHVTRALDEVDEAVDDLEQMSDVERGEIAGFDEVSSALHSAWNVLHNTAGLLRAQRAGGTPAP